MILSSHDCFCRLRIINLNCAMFVIFSWSSCCHIWNETNKTSDFKFFYSEHCGKEQILHDFRVLSITYLCFYHSAVALVTVNKKLSLLVIGCFLSLNNVCGSSPSSLIPDFYSPVIHLLLEFHTIMFVVYSNFPAGHLFLNFHPQNFSSASCWLTLPFISLHTDHF